MEKKYFSEIVLLTKTYNLQDFKDWLKWHLDIIHFDHIIVFDNESQVDIKSVCDSDDRVEYHFVEGWPDQYNIYNRYINNESKAWWVLPIDDDEFLYVGEKFGHDVNTMLLELQDRWKDMIKLSVGWVNLFPMEFTETRTKSLIENGNAYSFAACDNLRNIWRQSNNWVKTFTRMTRNDWIWAFDENGTLVNSGHIPTLKNRKTYSYMVDGSVLLKENGHYKANEIMYDCFLAHYQYKSNSEWIYKCRERKSAANKKFDKNKPLVYRKLYDYKNLFNRCNLLSNLWERNAK